MLVCFAEPTIWSNQFKRLQLIEGNPNFEFQKIMIADNKKVTTFRIKLIRGMIIENDRGSHEEFNPIMKLGKDISLKKLYRFDPDTIASIHNKYFPEIYRYALYRIGESTTAEDIASEVLLRLLEAIERGNGPKSSLHGWLLGTAANLINAHFRNKYNHSTVGLDEILTDEINPLQLAVDRSEAETVRIALQFLTQEQQHVLALRFSNRYSLEETAKIMGKKVNAIKALQFRALSSLRREVEKINQ